MKSTRKHRQLSEMINRKLNELDLPEYPARLYEPVRYTLELGGKRIRPYFTLIACGMSGGEVEEAVPAALAIELLHNFTLIHDDIMDAAETRRGKPSVFKKWNASTAILSGDVMFARAFRQLYYYGESGRYSKKQYAGIMEIFLECAEKVCEGQAFDLDYAERSNVTIQEYLKMIHGKTAALIIGAFMLGGAVADPDLQKLDLLRRIGRETGTAFQIQDDLLDAIADPTKFGKTTGGDIIEGKKTYLSILALQEGNSQQKRFIRESLSSAETGRQQIDKVVNLYDKLGVIEKTAEAIDNHYCKAGELLDEFPDTEYKKDLIEYLHKLKNREY